MSNGNVERRNLPKKFKPPITVYVPKVGVTHVLNTAEGQQSGTVDTNEKFYK